MIKNETIFSKKTYVEEGSVEWFEEIERYYISREARPRVW